MAQRKSLNKQSFSFLFLSYWFRKNVGRKSECFSGLKQAVVGSPMLQRSLNYDVGR
jgi:hypothetical protein